MDAFWCKYLAGEFSLGLQRAVSCAISTMPVWPVSGRHQVAKAWRCMRAMVGRLAKPAGPMKVHLMRGKRLRRMRVASGAVAP